MARFGAFWVLFLRKVVLLIKQVYIKINFLTLVSYSLFQTVFG